MKKAALLLSLLFVQSAFAIPIVCESQEKTNGISTLAVRINKKIPVQMNGNVWKMHVITITAQEPGQQRHRMYSTGGIRKESMSMTIVKDGFVYGNVSTRATGDGLYEGQIRIGGILRGRIMDVVCHDEEIRGQM